MLEHSLTSITPAHLSSLIDSAPDSEVNTEPDSEPEEASLEEESQKRYEKVVTEGNKNNLQKKKIIAPNNFFFDLTDKI